MTTLVRGACESNLCSSLQPQGLPWLNSLPAALASGAILVLGNRRIDSNSWDILPEIVSMVLSRERGKGLTNSLGLS
nr:MAG: hypothetical protein H4Rhizo439668_000002 [Mitovirus sp.]